VQKTNWGATRRFWFKPKKRKMKSSGDNKAKLQAAAISGVSNKSLLVYDEI
jgi:hypothetical protein